MQIATEGQRGIKGYGEGIRNVCSQAVLWRSSRWQRHVSTAIQSQMIPLMRCHLCDLGARPALRWKRRNLCVLVCATVCVCVECDGGSFGSYILSQQQAGVYLEPQGHRYFILPKHKPQVLAKHTQILSHTHSAAKAMSCLKPQFVRIVYYTGFYPVDTIVLSLSSIKGTIPKKMAKC